jgi:hypothetical protein
MGRCVPAVCHSAVVVYSGGLLASLLEDIDLPPRQGGVVCCVDDGKLRKRHSGRKSRAGLLMDISLDARLRSIRS